MPRSGDRWKHLRFTGKDATGRVIPTRQGNHSFGRQHFSGRRNIHNPKAIKIVTGEHPEQRKGARLMYGGKLVHGLKVLADIRVVVQYARTASGDRFDAGVGQRIGTIAAYCRGRNRCPDGVNR